MRPVVPASLDGTTGERANGVTVSLVVFKRARTPIGGGATYEQETSSHRGVTRVTRDQSLDSKTDVFAST